MIVVWGRSVVRMRERGPAAVWGSMFTRGGRGVVASRWRGRGAGGRSQDGVRKECL